MKIIEFAGDPRQINWPEEYVADLEKLSPTEQLRYFYRSPDYAYWTSKITGEGGYEWQNPHCLYTLPVEEIELLDGKIAAVHLDGSRLILGERVCTYQASDNNGAGYKEREDYAELVCGKPITFPRDFYRVQGDTVTFGPNMPEYPYAFLHVMIKPWEREAEEPIRHAIISDEATFIPEHMLEGMKSLETVHVPASIGEARSTLPKECQLYIGGIRVPDAFVSWDGILVRVREDVEEIRVPKTIAKIGRYAFEDCPSLKRVYIPESVAEIEEGAFDRFDDSIEIHWEQ